MVKLKLSIDVKCDKIKKCKCGKAFNKEESGKMSVQWDVELSFVEGLIDVLKYK